MRGSSVAFADAQSMWLTSAQQTIASVRHAGTAALDAPSPPASATNAATTAVNRQAPTSRNVTETEGRVVSRGDISALSGMRAGRSPQTRLTVQTCGALTN